MMHAVTCAAGIGSFSSIVIVDPIIRFKATACQLGADLAHIDFGPLRLATTLAQALEKSQEASPITEAPAMVAVDEFEPSGHSLLSKAFGAPYQR